MARRKSDASEIAYESILNRILSFEIMPGETVSDYQLSQELSMSRTPVREAIMRLTMDGLIVRDDTQMVVSSITPHDIIEICEVREAIENKAASLILKNGGLSAKQLTDLRSLNKEMKKRVQMNDYSATNDFDDKIHLSLVQFSGNVRLTEFFNRMRMQFRRVRWLTVLNPRYKISILEHSEIIEALAAKDAKRTQNAIQLHMTNAAANFNTVLEDKNLSVLRKSIDLLKHISLGQSEKVSG